MDLLVETRIKTDTELEVAIFPVDRIVVFANLELMDVDYQGVYKFSPIFY